MGSSTVLPVEVLGPPSLPGVAVVVIAVFASEPVAPSFTLPVIFMIFVVPAGMSGSVVCPVQRLVTPSTVNSWVSS